MPDDQPAFDDSGLYRWADEERFEVTRERIAEYAAATNDPVPADRSGDVVDEIVTAGGRAVANTTTSRTGMPPKA